MKAIFRDEIRKTMQEQFKYENEMQIPRLRQDRHQHGRRRGDRGFQEAFGGCRRTWR